MDGHDVQTASDGKEGLALISRNPFDVIFCDLRMPEMDGQALYEEIRHDYPQALKRIVFVTAQAHSPIYGPFLRETGAPVIEKPFTIQPSDGDSDGRAWSVRGEVRYPNAKPAPAYAPPQPASRRELDGLGP
jgi:DNA-binding NtrC family response regulator